jgi:hypothetical protein
LGTGMDSSQDFNSQTFHYHSLSTLKKTYESTSHPDSVIQMGKCSWVNWRNSTEY